MIRIYKTNMQLFWKLINTSTAYRHSSSKVSSKSACNFARYSVWKHNLFGRDYRRVHSEISACKQHWIWDLGPLFLKSTIPTNTKADPNLNLNPDVSSMARILTMDFRNSGPSEQWAGTGYDALRIQKQSLIQWHVTFSAYKQICSISILTLFGKTSACSIVFKKSWHRCGKTL